MKSTVLYTLLSVYLFISCGDERATCDLLDRADTLVETKPDSAYTLLNSIETPDNLNDKLFARWCMLYSRAADKLYKDMPYTIQLNRALHWYEKHGTSEQQAWIGLYLGRSYAEDKLFVPATNAYSDALELAKKKRLYNVAGYICSYMLVMKSKKRLEILLKPCNILNNVMRQKILFVVQLLIAYKNTVHTITSDNGKEFAAHEYMAKKLDAKFYFAHPYSS